MPLPLPTLLPHLLHAQETLYGPITTIPATTWTPPPQSGGGDQGRYLWTDAIGVLNFLTLHRIHPHPPTPTHYLTLATRLITTVHATLGRTRPSSTCTPAYLPGASPTHPLSGGLRIGKPSPDSDGQYHHYLTLWMFVLNRTSVVSGEAGWNELAVELGRGVHPRFFLGGEEGKRERMVWKMDVNLERVLVGSEGNLDPLDGWVVFRLVQGFQESNGDGKGKGVLEEEIEDYARILKRKGRQRIVDDMLDLGMTLWTAHWFLGREEWADELVERGVKRVYNLFEKDRYLDQDIRHRLAFREFGAAMGIRCVAEQEADKDRAVDLKVFADRIVDCWRPYMAGADGGEDELTPITQVMYASALMPGAFQRGFFGPEPVVPEWSLY
ncbi:hypothetical protein BO78DRAFT_367029 [Aspergillus sclerotiicarbonarius CBS 121057]|uniref:Uncharacterized protein n=1 Tax=Aspergillus sclerotiicarbonarius (strain CBS 121057 / IBT 28362) TaxID=1448318 RepID=A0A319EY24_ASPSB|nr:hypothetical protein BO78DRAFT_367029 [Aspergillus sclerotiicarbonarius CBS 121057]